MSLVFIVMIFSLAAFTRLVVPSTPLTGTYYVLVVILSQAFPKVPVYRFHQGAFCRSPLVERYRFCILALFGHDRVFPVKHALAPAFCPSIDSSVGWVAARSSGWASGCFWAVPFCYS